jgi:antirestriction protein
MSSICDVVSSAIYIIYQIGIVRNTTVFTKSKSAKLYLDFERIVRDITKAYTVVDHARQQA